MKKSIFIRAFNKEVQLIRVSFCIILMLIVILSFKFTVGFYKNANINASKNFIARDSIIRKSIDKSDSKILEVYKLKEQYYVIDKIKKIYLDNALSFNSYGYSFTALFAIASIITAILGFLLLRTGWDNNQNFYLKASFLIMFFASTLFKILPTVYDNKINTKNNLTKYNYYFGLQIDIYDLVNDNSGFIKKNQLDSLNTYASRINKKIKENQDLYFDIYTEKIPGEINIPVK